MEVRAVTHVEPPVVVPVQLTLIRTLVGGGVEGDPIRWVVFLYDEDGMFLGQLDPAGASEWSADAYRRLEVRMTS